MATPTRPTLSVVALSNLSFRGDITGDSGVTHNLYYRRAETTANNDTLGGTRVGNGSITVNPVAIAGHSWLVYVTSVDAGFVSLPAISYISLAYSDSLLGAIQSRWSANAALVTTAGPLFSEEAPETLDGTSVELPYTIICLDRTSTTWTFEAQYFELTGVEFQLYGTSLSTLEAARRQVQDLFAWQYLQFLLPATCTVFLQPTDYHLQSTLSRWRDGKPVYRASLSYDAMTERSLI